MDAQIILIVNGTEKTVVTDPQRSLLDVLREDLHLTGPKYGCGEGRCGACTVLLDGEPIRSCITIALTVAGREVTTVEGLSRGRELHPLQRAFHEHGASQCGFCTSGMLMSAKVLLDKNRNPSRREIADFMSGNLCRCGTYEEVTEAIQSVASGTRKE